MTFRRLGGRARLIARTFVFSLCVATPFSSAVFAQSSSKKAQFNDARLLNILADDNQAPAAQKKGVVTAEHRESQRDAQSPNIRSVGVVQRDASTASRSAAQPISQAQYTAAPSSASSAQGFSGNLLATDGKFDDVCPDPRDMPSILDVPYKVPTQNVPENCPLPDETFQRKAPTPITFTWKASSLCYKPLYFEDVQLERYGHYCHPLLQPALSRVRFFLTIPCLPYLMGVDPPNQCIYDLGYYRPGNCAPSMLEPIPISLRGALIEAGAVVGAAAAIP
jgi:hypothetical protein